jgi:hypothetical protein
MGGVLDEDLIQTYYKKQLFNNAALVPTSEFHNRAGGGTHILFSMHWFGPVAGWGVLHPTTSAAGAHDRGAGAKPRVAGGAASAANVALRGLALVPDGSRRSVRFGSVIRFR